MKTLVLDLYNGTELYFDLPPKEALISAYLAEVNSLNISNPVSRGKVEKEILIGKSTLGLGNYAVQY